MRNNNFFSTKIFFFLKKTFVVSLFKFLSAITSYFLFILVARKFGANESGVFFLALSIITFLSVVGRFGLDNLLLKKISIFFVSNDNVKTIHLISKILLLVLFLDMILIFSLFYLLDLFLNKKEIINSLKIMLPIIMFFNLNFMIAIYHQATKKIFLSIIIINFLSNFIALLFILFKDFNNISDFIIYFTISNFLALIIALIILSITKSSEIIIFKKLSFSLLKDSFSYYSYIVMTQLNLWIGTFIIGYYETSQNVAYFSSAQRSSMIIILILASINTITASKFANLIHLKSKKILSEYIYIATRSSVLISLPIILIFLLFPEFVLSFFGEDFTSGSNVLQIFAIGQLFNVFTGPVGNILSMSPYVNYLKKITIFTLFFSGIITILLVKSYGIIGGAIGFSVGIIVQNLLLAYIVHKKLKINVYSSFFKKIKN